MNRSFRCAVLLLLATCSAACATASDGRWVELRGKRFVVEVVDTEAQRQRGLMFRDAMADDHGMVFIHDYEAPQAYWMKNTKIPLDIYYFDHARKLVSVSRDVPPCSLGDRCPPFASEAPALYVLELNAGTAQQLGVQPGDEIKFGPGVHERK